MQEHQTTLTFDRQRFIIWVCDLKNSSSALNDPQRVDAAEEYLQRFYWLSTRLLLHSGASVTKWTGDGFLAAFVVPLDREIGRVAYQIFDLAWHLTVVCHVTSLGMSRHARIGLRHGVALDPDAIRVDVADVRGGDVIGRGAVFASRLSGLDAPFPGIVTHRAVVQAASEIGPRYEFKRRRLRKIDVLKYFKGERRGTGEVYQSSATRRRAPLRINSLIRNANQAIGQAESTDSPPPAWLVAFIGELESGPPWAKQVYAEWTRFVREDLFAPLKSLVELMEQHQNRLQAALGHKRKTGARNK